MLTAIAAILVVLFAILLAWVPMAREGKIACSVLLVIGMVILLYGGVSVHVGGGAG